jgi:transposase-like protein
MHALVRRYPLAYKHVSELLAERGVTVDASCIWRWVQTYAPGFGIPSSQAAQI